MRRESTGRVRREVVRAHMDGFEQAMEAALEAASELGTGDHDIEVRFEAHITVTNPGVVNEYAVRLISQND